MTRRPIELLLAALVAGCQPPEATVGAPVEHDQALACTSAAEAFRGSYVSVPIDASRQRATTGAPVEIYLNRLGANLAGSYDDAAHNQSSVVASTGNASVAISPYPGSDAEWAAVVACVKDEFSRFNVTITDQRPTSPDFMMAMFGGTAAAMGYPSNVGGVAPLDSNGCQNVPKAVVFTFSGAVGPNPQLNCEIAAQEISHAFSLDHEFLAADPMTYLQYGGHKTFQDQDAQCGEYQARPCLCGRPSQNSVKTLIDHVGAAGNTSPMNPAPDTTPPTITLVSPADGASVTAGSVDVVARVSDDGTVASATLYWQDSHTAVTSRCGDGVLPCVAQGGVYTWTLPSVGEGPAQLHVGAIDGAGNAAVSETRGLKVTGSGSNPNPNPMPSMTVKASVDGGAFTTSRTVVARATVQGGDAGTRATVIWTDATGKTERIPMCPSSASAFSLTMSIALHAGVRSFVVEATDAGGHTATSAKVKFTID